MKHNTSLIYGEFMLSTTEISFNNYNIVVPYLDISLEKVACLIQILISY